MRNAFGVIRSGLVDLWDRAFFAIGCSLTWLVLVLLIIPAPPAIVAVFYVSERIIARDHFLEYRDYLRAVRRYFGLGWRWAAINIPVIVILVVDVLVVPQMLSATLALSAQYLLILLLAVWLMVNWFALAFLFQQEEPSVRQALRNGGVLFLRYPGFSLILTFITAILLALSLVFPIVNVFFGPMGAGLIGTYAVVDRLALFRGEQDPTARD